jgi:peptide/nickel transport system substrate-binding protein
MGTPQYGGTLVSRASANTTVWDPYLSTNGTSGVLGQVMQQLWMGDYTVDPNTWDYSIGWLPSKYATGLMITGYDMPNTYTVICHLRNDIYWQNLPPVNGRQFVASDVVAHYNRMLGLGGGFSKSPYYVSVTGWNPLISVVATDKLTVTFNWTPGTSAISILTIMQANGADDIFEAPEAIAAFTTTSTPWITNWKNSIGTGPYILSDFVDSSSLTYTANPNYWEKDLRWPQNKLPYIKILKTLIIPNNATAEAAFRVGKVDSFGSMPTQDALNMMKTNPWMVVKQVPQGNELTLDPRNDVAPFNNLNVRIAFQHAINIPLIASTYFQGYATPWPASLTENQMGIGGWGCAYPDWPDSTKAEYTFDLALSKKMLAAAGVAGMHTSCILESDALTDLYTIVQSQLADAGVTMDITMMDPAAWQSTIMTAHKYDAFCARNQGLMGFNFDIFRQMMRYGVKGYQTNYILVDDPVPQKAYADAMLAQDVETVQKILHDLNLYIATQHYAISIAQPSAFNMVQPWIKGNPGANTMGNYTGYSRCWIDANVRAQYIH